MTWREQRRRESERKGRREERQREQVDLLINNHKVRQAVPGWVGPVRKQQLRICRACKGLKQHRSAFFVPLAKALKGQGDTCWWLRGTRLSPVSAGTERMLRVVLQQLTSDGCSEQVGAWVMLLLIHDITSVFLGKRLLITSTYSNGCWYT